MTKGAHDGSTSTKATGFWKATSSASEKSSCFLEGVKLLSKATGNSREPGAGSVGFEIEVRSPSARIASAGNRHEKARKDTKKESPFVSFRDFLWILPAR